MDGRQITRASKASPRHGNCFCTRDGGDALGHSEQKTPIGWSGSFPIFCHFLKGGHYVAQLAEGFTW